MLGASQRMKIAYLVQCLTDKENLHERAVVYPAASNLEDERTSRRSRVKRLVGQKPIEIKQATKPTQVGVVPDEQDEPIFRVTKFIRRRLIRSCAENGVANVCRKMGGSHLCCVGSAEYEIVKLCVHLHQIVEVCAG